MAALLGKYTAEGAGGGPLLRTKYRTPTIMYQLPQCLIMLSDSEPSEAVCDKVSADILVTALIPNDSSCTVTGHTAQHVFLMYR